MTSQEEQPSNQPDPQKVLNDKNNLKLKFVALRNGLIEEKNKNKQIIIENENLQKEIEELKKLNTELNTKNSKLDEENQVLKEENVTKQELINKLKEELQKYMDKSSKKLTKFFSSLLESDTQQNVDIEVKDKNNLKIESLEQENFKLNKELTDIKNNLDISDKKLSESTKELITLKEKSKKELEELEIKYKKEIEEINKEKSNKEKNLNQKIQETEKKMLEYANALRDKELVIKSIESIRGDRDKDVILMKEKVRIAEETLNKNNEEMKIMQNNKKSMEKDIIKYKTDIEDLNMQIQQYKLIIDDLTPISINYVFKGKILNENLANKNIEICFGKYQQSIYFKIGDKEFILVWKEVCDMLGNKYIPGQIKIILKLNGEKNNSEILAQFTKKESEYIRKFYREFKYKSSTKEEELMNLSLNNYFY
jgi:chromosome segregation ATPase